MAFEFGGERSEETTTGRKTEREKQTRKETESQAQAQQQKQVTKQVGEISYLDIETQDFVKDLIAQLGGDISLEGKDLMSDLAASISARAQTAETDIAAQISPIVTGARAEGERQLQALQTQLAQQAGGSLANTLVTSSTAQGRADLETQIAKLEGELTLQARGQVTQELTAALQGAAGLSAEEARPTENITNLLNILKGAQVEQTQLGEAATTTESTLNRILDALSTRDLDVSTREDVTAHSLTASLGF